MIPAFIPLLPGIISPFVTEDVVAYDSSVVDYVRYLIQADPEVSLIPKENLLERIRDIVMKLGRRTFEQLRNYVSIGTNEGSTSRSR